MFTKSAKIFWEFSYPHYPHSAARAAFLRSVDIFMNSVDKERRFFLRFYSIFSFSSTVSTVSTILRKPSVYKASNVKAYFFFWKDVLYLSLLSRQPLLRKSAKYRQAFCRDRMCKQQWGSLQFTRIVIRIPPSYPTGLLMCI